MQATGTAVVYGALVTHARIVDLASGGVRLVVEDTSALPDVDAYVELDVRLDGLGRWLRVSGFVVRVDVGESRSTMVIELLVVPPDFEDLVQDELLSALECVRLPRVMLVDAAHARRELVAGALRATGCRVIEARSPLEAIAALDQSRLHLLAVVIADTKVASHAVDLRRFLGEMYPGVRLIDVGRGDRSRPTTSLSVDGVPDLALQIFDLVVMPEQLRGRA